MTNSRSSIIGLSYEVLFVSKSLVVPGQQLKTFCKKLPVRYNLTTSVNEKLHATYQTHEQSLPNIYTLKRGPRFRSTESKPPRIDCSNGRCNEAENSETRGRKGFRFFPLRLINQSYIQNLGKLSRIMYFDTFKEGKLYPKGPPSTKPLK